MNKAFCPETEMWDQVYDSKSLMSMIPEEKDMRQDLCLDMVFWIYYLVFDYKTQELYTLVRCRPTAYCGMDCTSTTIEPKRTNEKDD